MTRSEDTLSSRDLNRLCSLIYEQSGINIGTEKKLMLEGRLKRRMNKLKLASYKEYCDFLFSRHGANREEVIHLIDAVSTNKTDFFRESSHFDYLVNTVIPGLLSSRGTGHEFKLWSAACSTGEEPYTLAMVLSEYESRHPGFRYRLLASDISTEVLSKAQLGIFTAEAARAVPAELRRKYFMRNRDSSSNLLRIVPEIRQKIDFQRLNLMHEFGLSDRMDVIFCRNVIIYFDTPTQEQLFARFDRKLTSGGYIFVGHSENLHHLGLSLVPVAPAVYRKQG